MAQPPAFTIHVMNPRKKTGRKKAAKKVTKVSRTVSKTITKNPTKKKAAKRRRVSRGHSEATRTVGNSTQKRSTTTMAKKRRKKATKRRSTRGTATTRTIVRRRRNPAPVKRKKRRRNPSIAGGFGGVISEMQNSLPRLIGKLSCAWMVQRVSTGPGGLFGQSHTSATAGEGWSLPQYGVAALTAWFGPKLFGRFLGGGTEFRRGVVDLIVEKFVWTEIIARNQWAVGQFGAGDVGYNAGTGQSYVNQGGRWNAMQGLVAQTPLDGLVEQTPLDGPLDHQYGHLMSQNASVGVQRAGKWHGAGYTSPYHAAFTR